MGAISQRNREILTGLVFTILSIAIVTLGIKWANGAFDPGYDLEGTFSTAGQGLQSGSDVKIRGVNVGSVSSVALQDGAARVRMRMEPDAQIPVQAQAVIRPKTLFGEKFVDIIPGSTEQSGPFLGDEAEITDTVGAIELQRIFDDAYPIIEAIDPTELMNVLATLAEASRGSAENVNRSIGNGAEVLDVTARHDADTRRFLDDFAELSDTIAVAAEHLVAGGRDLNAVLPDLNARSGQLTQVLEQAARLSADAADILENNTSFLEKNVVQGGKAIDVLHRNRADIPGLVRGLRQFAQGLSSVLRIESPNGTLLAAVKFVMGAGDVDHGSPEASATTSVPTFDPSLLDGLVDPLGPIVRDGADAIGQVLTDALPLGEVAP